MSYRDLTTITSPVAVSGFRATPLLPLEPSAMLYEQDFLVARGSYASAAFSDTNATYTSAYFVGDTAFRDMGDSVWQFTRQWATVPASFSEFETVAFTYPALAASVSGSSATVTAMTKSGSNIELTTTVSGVSAGDTVYLNVQFTESPFTYSRFGWYKVVSTGTNIVRVAAAFLSSASSFSSVSGTIQKGALGRSNPKTVTVTSRLGREFLYTASPSTELPAFQAFRPVAATGDDVTTLSVTTIPSVSTYQGYLASGAELVAESRVTRWRGNIYERVTRYVPAL